MGELHEVKFDNRPKVKDILDVLWQMTHDDEVAEAVLIVEKLDGELQMIPTYDSPAEVIGAMEIAKNNYIHIMQHRDELDSEE